MKRLATEVDFCDWLNGIRRIANMVSDSLPVAAVQKRHPTTLTTPAQTNFAKSSGRKFVHVAVVDG